VVVPAYNEARNLEEAVRDVVSAAAGFKDFEVLIVNDGSTDDTGEIAARLARAVPHVTAIHHPRNLGFAAAYRTALTQARMSYVTFVPGDHEVAPESIRDIFAAVGSADLVIPYHATPHKRARHRRLLTWVCTRQLNWLFGWRLRYYQGPTVYPTALAQALPATVSGFFFATEMLVEAVDAGYTWVEVGLIHQERAYGASKAVALSNVMNAQQTMLRLWWDVRIRRKRAIPRVERETAWELLGGMQ